MNKIKLAVTGCLGRMGQQIIKSSKLDKKFKDQNKNKHSIKNILYTSPTNMDDTYSNPYRPPLKNIPINIETQP